MNLCEPHRPQPSLLNRKVHRSSWFKPTPTHNRLAEASFLGYPRTKQFILGGMENKEWSCHQKITPYAFLIFTSVENLSGICGKGYTQVYSDNKTQKFENSVHATALVRMCSSCQVPFIPLNFQTNTKFSITYLLSVFQQFFKGQSLLCH